MSSPDVSAGAPPPDYSSYQQPPGSTAPPDTTTEAATIAAGKAAKGLLKAGRRWIRYNHPSNRVLQAR